MATNIEILQYVVLPVVLALIAIVPGILKVINSKRKQKVKEDLEVDGQVDMCPGGIHLNKVVDDISHLYHIMRTIMTYVPTINRALIIRMHNSGGEITPINDLYLTAIHEVALGSTEPMLEDIKKRPVDLFHMDYILTPLIRSGEVIVDKDTAEGEIKKIYEAYNHTWSYAKRLSSDSTSMTYIILSFKSGSEGDLTPINREKINAGINRVRNIIDQY